MLILFIVILMLILMLLNLKSGYADTDADQCLKIMPLCCNNVILTLNAGINSSFCIFLLFTLTSVSFEFKITFLPLVDQKYMSQFLNKNHSDKLSLFNVQMFARSSTLTYKSHVILSSLTVGTPRSRASADDFSALCPAEHCYQTLVKQIQCENQD